MEQETPPAGSASNKRRRLVPLAPAPAGSSGHGASAGSGSKGRRQVTAACEACRKRKSKCNAERPKCSLCLRHGSECRYATAPAETHSQALKRKHHELQNRITPYEELFGLLKTKSETETLEILRRIRTGDDVNSILRHARDGDLLIQLSLAPEARRRYEFPYIRDMPSYILMSDNLYLRSFVYETTFRAPPTHGFETETQREGYGDERYLKPYHAAQVVEPSFDDVNVSKWTSVSSDNHLLRRLLTSYVLYQHPWTAAFHIEPFIKDMISGRTDFCSSLLVNAALAAACHMCREIPDRNKFWVPQTLGYRFMAEAKRLWEVESRRNTGSLPTIQAAILLGIVSTTTAMDKVGTSYLLQAMAMAEEMDLFSARVGTDDQSLRRVRAFTAWGIYTWQAWQRFYFSAPPHLKKAPEFPLPDPVTDPKFYGEIWIRYPMSPRLHSVDLGHLIKANFELRHLMNQMALELFEEGKAPCISVEKALECKSRLDNWFVNLPDVLSPTKIVFPDHIKIHIEYYGNMITLIRFLRQPGFTLDLTWHNIITHAEVRLETLLRLYYLRHSFEGYDPLIMHWLLFLGDATLQKIDKSGMPVPPAIAALSPPADIESLRSTLILCAKGLYDQGHNYHIAVLVYRILRDRMKANDLDLVRTHLFSNQGPRDDDMPLMTQYVQAQWVAPILTRDKDAGDPSRNTLDYLLGEYEKLSLDRSGVVEEISDSSSNASSAERHSPP
ncbi:uncharacterized protein F4812DRAFT_440233 [Daldinia caldariorum]|uniref:uncharacterized protein n=1 Tax=Daldinia caldariorum TaxID=326644 RepID=UPI002007D5D2|nr:uncharacterized protein F4812DRAFT_440233 [Daldinia caldariorum]KAI1465251.1 hypothetical protein F4812DRAFT_440233 [Daldinia caldariorum]